ncbi:MAG: competence/damage-inducible protein A [Clostridiales bacterium]|jgi:nicotinamide-nucleotide amidase|nr:competence/damage-inducible protein A [Clostridiales bacterium]
MKRRVWIFTGYILIERFDYMVAEIVSVGTELLLGDIINTNAAFLAKELKNLGFSVYFQQVVGDNELRLKSALDTASNRSDVIILTGGLGPTQDDLTKEVTARYLNLGMEFDEYSWNEICSFFAKLRKTPTENNRKQAYFPKGSVILKNPNGTAPGCLIESNSVTYVMLPGPPFEMEAMFENEVKPHLLQKSSSVLYSKTLRVVGIGESEIEDRLKDLIEKQTNPTIAPYAKSFEVHLRITALADSFENAREKTLPLTRAVYDILGNNIYGEDSVTLEETVVALLKEKGIKLACAESCTGGLISSRLVNIAGVSEVFMEGVVTYSNESKIARLGVKRETLEKYGAVSEQTAGEMAAGVAGMLGCEAAVSVTGIAGSAQTNSGSYTLCHSVAASSADENAASQAKSTPGENAAQAAEASPKCDNAAQANSPAKEPGLVYIGIYLNGEITVKKFNFAGSRQRIRNQSAQMALDMLRRKLLNGI